LGVSDGKQATVVGASWRLPYVSHIRMTALWAPLIPYQRPTRAPRLGVGFPRHVSGHIPVDRVHHADPLLSAACDEHADEMKRRTGRAWLAVI